MKITREFLHWLFEYREDGSLIWKNHWHASTRSKVVGKPAGNFRYDKSGLIYRQVMINGKNYLEHRLIYFMFHGFWPEQIDHIDGNGLNNKIENLRASNNTLNQWNRSIHRKGRLRNIYFCKKTNKWRGRFVFKGKKYCVGRHDTEIQAFTAVYLKQKELERL